MATALFGHRFSRSALLFLFTPFTIFGSTPLAAYAFQADATITETGPNYSAFRVPSLAQPEYLEKVVDPVFGSTITRVTGDYGSAVQGLHGVKWNSSKSGNRHQYSHIPAWNADGSLLYIETAGVLINGRAPYNAISKLSWPSGANEARWDPADPDSMIFVGSKGIHRKNVRTGETSLLNALLEFSGDTLSIGNYEGDIVDDGSKVLVTAVDANPPYAFPFYLDSNTKGAVFNLPKNSDYATFSPLGEYVFIDGEPKGDYEIMQVWKVNESNGNVQIEAVWDTGKSGSATPNHADLLAIDCVEYVVGRTEGSQTINGILVADGAVVLRPLKNSNSLDSMTVLFKESWCSHTSVSNKLNTAWAVCTYGEWNPKAFETNRAQGEIVAVRTDGSGEVRRIAHHRSTQNEYWAQAQASVSPDGSLVVFASDWGEKDGQVNAYVAETGIVEE